jgi:hypothetical protein
MSNVISSVTLLTFGLFSSLSNAVTDQEKAHENDLQEIATNTCNSERIEGRDYKIKVLGDGNLEVSFFGKKGGTLGGKFVYSKKEWEGQQRVLKKDQLSENFNRRKCLKDELRYLRKSYSAPASETLYYGAYSLAGSNEVGWATKQVNVRDAEDLALDRCDDINCKIIFTIQGDECGTIVGGHGKWHYGIGGSRHWSKESAFSICSDLGPRNKCVLVNTICASSKDRY